MSTQGIAVIVAAVVMGVLILAAALVWLAQYWMDQDDDADRIMEYWLEQDTESAGDGALSMSRKFDLQG
jgi:hypothetical protein